MFSGVTALLTRSFRLDTRQVMTHLFRLAFVVFLYFGLLVAQATSMFVGAPGLNFFQKTVTLNAIFVTLAGISFFATAVTEEKEENTLGLLRMAGLNPIGILLGKSTSRLVQVLLLLAIQFPFTLLSITLGGVTMAQIYAAYAGLIAYTALIANVALLCSVVFRNSGTASAMTLIWFIGYCFVWPIGTWGLTQLQLHGVTPATTWGWLLTEFCTIVRDSNIFYHLWFEITVTGFSGSPLNTQFFSNSLTGLGCFLLSWAVFDLSTQNGGATNQVRGFVLLPRSGLRFLTPGRCWNWGLVWKDFHFVAGGWTFWLLKFSLYLASYPLLWAYLNYAQFRTPLFDEQMTALYLGALYIAIAVEAAVLSSRIFHDEIKGQTMSSLLMLPRSVAEIGYSKMLGCLLGLVPALVCLTLSACILPEGAKLVTNVISTSAFWGGVLGVVVLTHLTALLSLFVKWGALPLAFLILIVSTWCCPILLVVVVGIIEALGDDNEFVAILALWLITAVIAFVFHMMIGSRLQEVGTK